MIVSGILILPGLVHASNNWDLHEKVNTISASGSCSGKQVRIDLFFGAEKNPIYTSGAPCSGGKFQFSDNLLQWESLKDGEYRLALNSDLTDTKKVSIDRPVAQINTGVAEESKPGKIDPGVEEESTFLDAFVGLQKSIFEMRERLETTEYPEIAKLSLGSMLDGMDMAIGKMTELIFAPQEEAGNETGENSVEIVQTDISAEKVEENLQSDGTEVGNEEPVVEENEELYGQESDDPIEEKKSENGVDGISKKETVDEKEDILLMEGGIEINTGSGDAE